MTESNRGGRPISRDSSARAEAAKKAMLKRSQKSSTSSQQQQLHIVVGGFAVFCVAIVIYTLLNPKVNFAELPIIDPSQILVHNGQGHFFTHGENDFFKDKVVSDAKYLFANYLSDSNNLNECASKDVQEDEEEVPMEYNWKEKYPDCVKPAKDQGDCASGYAHSTLSMVEDRICQLSNEQVTLSSKEIIDCEVSSQGCEGGYVNRVLNWGKRKGFIPEECMPSNGVQEECPIDHLLQNECRQAQNVYKIIDYCIAQQQNIKREIFFNGPVVGQFTPFTDVLAYKDGVYHKTQEAFKFQGVQSVVIYGWAMSAEGFEYWLVENSWGSSWGIDGDMKVMIRNDAQVDLFGIGGQAFPYTLAEFYAQQQLNEAMAQMQDEYQFTDSEGEHIDLDA